MKHQVRWMKSTRFSRPKGHFGTSLTFSLPFGLLGAFVGLISGQWQIGVACLAWSIATRMLMAIVVGGAVLNEGVLWRLSLLYPLRDLMGFGFWAASYGSNTILWRGELYELGEGGYMRSANSPGDKKQETALTA
jgi:ceramide glucosyltransferase